MPLSQFYVVPHLFLAKMSIFVALIPNQMVEYLIVCPLVFLGGFVDAVAGGGGLISLPAYMLAGLPPIEAIGTNKFSACCGTAVATWRYSRCGFNIGDTLS